LQQSKSDYCKVIEEKENKIMSALIGFIVMITIAIYLATQLIIDDYFMHKK